MKKILFLSLIMLCTAMSAWSQTTDNVALLFNDNTPSKTTNPETGISVQATPHTEDYQSAWKVDEDNALELSVPQCYVITKVEFEYSGFFENGDCINQCDCLIFDTESKTWVQKDGKLDYFSTIKFNAEHPAYVSAVFVYYHRCSGATYHEAVNATCTTKGKAEYWECTCGKIYSDADCTNMVTDMTSLATEIDPTNHINGLQECLRVAPTCVATGTEHHWHCADCEQNFSDKEGKEKMTNLELSIDPTNHADLEEHARVEATCTKDGNILYWHCNGCGKDFDDKDAENEIADVTISKELDSHKNLVPVEAKAATETEIGYTVDHWHCQDCGKNFADQECTTPITDDVIIPITGTLNYLCFTANAVGSTVELIKKGKPNDVILQYSTDYCKNWETVDFETSSTTGTITLEKVNDKVYFRNTKPASEVYGFSKDYSGVYNNDYRFKMSGSIAASGNVMSLVDSEVESEKIPADYCFAYLFQECSALTSAPELPATNLANNCYYYMFNACKNLMSAPELPATTLAEGCYESMFARCSSLTNAPKLPAMELKDNCYSYMFIWCASLTKAPELPATTLAESCYFDMFSSCKNLTEAPELPAMTLAKSCYKLMFYGCESLTEAPDLPATTLCTGCYNSMFEDCTNLKSIKVGFTDWYDDAATYEWLDDTAADGVFICPDALDKTQRSADYIPEGWKPVFEVKANKDPESVNYYSTFYSGANAYEVPSGVTAYTGVAEGNVLKLTAIESGVIPAEEPVILKASQSQVYLPYTTETGNKSDGNKLSGTDEEKTLGANQYALSLGQYGVGFYLWEDKSIDAHKAYLELPASSAKAFTFQFEDEADGIQNCQLSTVNSQLSTYNLNGMRVGKDYKGIVIVNGKKVYQR